MTRLNRVGCACVTLLFVLGLARVSMAAGGSAVEELSKRLPDNVIGLVATSGGDALKDDFNKAALGRIWNDQGVQTFYKSVKTELINLASKESGDQSVGQKVDMVLQYAQLVLSRPVAIGLMQAKVEDGPPAGLFVIVNAGPRKAELTAALGKLEAMAGEGEIVDRQIGDLKMRSVSDMNDLPLYWGWVEDYLVVALNDAQNVAAKYVASPRSAASATVGKLPAGDDALVEYYDFSKVGTLINWFIEEEGDPGDAAMLAGVAKSLGLTGMKTLIARIGFAGSDLVGDALLEMPVPATGLFAAYKPIDPAWLGAADSRAVSAAACNVDVASLYDLAMNTIKTVSPDEEYPEVQKGIAAFESEAKVQIRGGLLNSLAGPAVFYVLPAGKLTEAPQGGFVVAAKVKDAKQFETVVNALGEFAAAQAQGMLQVSEQKLDDGRVQHVWTIAPLAMMGVMPTWSISGDHVLIGSNKELCDMGVKQLTAKGPDAKSLVDTEGYKKATAGLPSNLISLNYTDSGVQLEQMMTQLQQIWPMATMMAMQAGIKLPVMLPSLTAIAKDLTPSCGYRYFSPEGLRWHYRGSGIEVSQMAAAGAGVGAAVALPALAKARDQARRVASMSNLKQIGLALIMYANDHENKLPDDLKAAEKYGVTGRVLESPFKPNGFTGPSYIYISGLSTSMDSQSIIAYENPAFREDGTNAVFLDGHVEFLTPDAFREKLAATYKELGKEAPAIKFKGEAESKPSAPATVTPSEA